MSNVYIIENTAGTLAITLKPGSLNGPGSAQHDTDMRLYGMGALLWGEGVDENILRLAENFACPAKELNDYNPFSSPVGNFDYDPSIDPILPKDSHDLGAGRGINTPIVGQTWFNTSSGKLYTYVQVSTSPDTFVWQSTGGVTLAPATEAPSSPNDGDLWFDETENQLKIYAGGTWESVADRYLLLDGTVTMAGDINMTTTGSPSASYSIINLRDPIDPQDAATKNYVDTEVGNILTGGALDGVYLRTDGTNAMDTASTITFGSGHLVINGGAGDVTVGPDVYATGQMLIASDNSMNFHVDANNLSSGDFVVSKGSTSTGSGETELFRIYNNGQLRSGVSNYETLVTHDDAIPNKKYVDDEISSLGSSGSIPAINPTTPKDGDIKVEAGPVISIYGGGGWNQVFPAVYSG